MTRDPSIGLSATMSPPGFSGRIAELPTTMDVTQTLRLPPWLN
jgi:hypothetical protein